MTSKLLCFNYDADHRIFQITYVSVTAAPAALRRGSGAVHDDAIAMTDRKMSLLG